MTAYVYYFLRLCKNTLIFGRKLASNFIPVYVGSSSAKLFLESKTNSARASKKLYLFFGIRRLLSEFFNDLVFFTLSFNLWKNWNEYFEIRRRNVNYLTFFCILFSKSKAILLFFFLFLLFALIGPPI